MTGPLCQPAAARPELEAVAAAEGHWLLERLERRQRDLGAGGVTGCRRGDWVQEE